MGVSKRASETDQERLQALLPIQGSAVYINPDGVLDVVLQVDLIVRLDAAELRSGTHARVREVVAARALASFEIWLERGGLKPSR